MDFRADPMLYEACKDDSESLCKGLKPGGGRIQACLVRGVVVVGEGTTLVWGQVRTGSVRVHARHSFSPPGMEWKDPQV